MNIHPRRTSPHTFAPRSTNATPYASDPPLPNLDHVRFRPYWYARSYVRRSRRPALDLDDHHREGHRQAADGNARSALEQHVRRELLPVIRQAWLLDEPRPRKVRRVHAGSYIMRLPGVPPPGLPLWGGVPVRKDAREPGPDRYDGVKGPAPVASNRFFGGRVLHLLRLRYRQ